MSSIGGLNKLSSGIYQTIFGLTQCTIGILEITASIIKTIMNTKSGIDNKIYT